MSPGGTSVRACHPWVSETQTMRMRPSCWGAAHRSSRAPRPATVSGLHRQCDRVVPGLHVDREVAGLFFRVLRGDPFLDGVRLAILVPDRGDDDFPLARIQADVAA